MSVREEDRQRNCPSRGLGIAAAAIGVGVGAALFYFFNKRSENPDASGSTTDWTYEEQQALQGSSSEDPSSSDTSMDDVSTYESDFDTSDEEHSPISEYSPTSAHSLETIPETSVSDTSADMESLPNISSDVSMPAYDELNTSSNAGENSYVTISESTTTDTSVHDSDGDISIISNQNDGDFIIPLGVSTSTEGWEEIMSQLHLPTPSQPSHLDIVINFFDRIIEARSKPKPSAEALRLAKIREQKFRERSWTLEECSICFDSMQREHAVMALPCAHRFHQPCILRWLEQRHTCPNCRKDA